MCRGDKDCAAGVSSLANEEPLVVVKACVDIVRKVVGEDRGDGRDGMVGKREATLRSSGYGSVRQLSSGTKNGYIGCSWGVGSHRRSEVFASRRSDEDIVGVYSDVFVERGEEEGVENFLGDLGGSGRHSR